MDVENVLTKVSDNLSVRRAFGAAYEKDGLLIIPVAMVAGGGGGGTSRSRHQHGNSADRPETLAAPDAAAHESGPADAGGGFGGLVLPSGAYVVKGDQVRWVPAVDTTIVVLASLALVRMLAAAMVRISRNRGRR